MSPVELDYIAFLARNAAAASGLLRLLTSPEHVFWHAATPAHFSRGVERVMGALAEQEDMAGLFRLHLVMEALIHRDRIPAWLPSWLDENLPTCDYLPVSLVTALACPWCAVPVATVIGQGKTRIDYFIAGMLPKSEANDPWPLWAAPLFDDNARNSLRTARELALRRARHRDGAVPWAFPLAVPNGRKQFTGTSLGLPLALAFLSVATERPLSPLVIATGELRPDGTVGSVGFLEEKIGGAREIFQAVLYPAENGGLAACERLALFPVNTLDQAWMLAYLHSPGECGRLALYAAMMEDPDLFVRNIQAVPKTWLAWSLENGYLQLVLQRICCSESLFDALADRLQSAVREGRIDDAEFISALMDAAGETERMAKTAPLTAFRWASLNVCIKNHRGLPVEAAMWADNARGLLDQALQADMHMVCNFFNHEFVSRHNRYDFRPELPMGLGRLLDSLEAQYALQCAFGCRVHKILGRLYGTIAQNFAFCGPERLTETLAYSEKAMKALGKEAVSAPREEWLRQFNYRTYALLDARDHDAARESLFNYLMVDGWSGVLALLPRFTPWHHALTARFLADTGDAARREYYEWCRRHPVPPPVEAHPWQLWCLNMARIARSTGREEEAAGWARKSLDLCFSSRFGPTVHVMALLPLSELLELEGISGPEIAHLETRFRAAAITLNPIHFQPLLEMEFREVPTVVGRSPGRFFPFTYR